MATRHLKRAIYLYKSLKIQVRVFYWQFSLLSRSSLEARHVIFLPRERLLNQMTICPITAHFPIKVANVGPREILHKTSMDTIVTFQQVRGLKRRFKNLFARSFKMQRSRRTCLCTQTLFFASFFQMLEACGQLCLNIQFWSRDLPCVYLLKFGKSANWWRIFMLLIRKWAVSMQI